MHVRTDRQIRKDVETALRDCAAIDGLAIEVCTVDGVIELQGEVRTHSERLNAMTLARQAAAPAPVRSAMRVAALGSDFELGDREVAAEVAAALAHCDIEPGAVTFEVHNRVVTLHGEVADAAARTRIRHIVQGARGTDFIDNRIVIRS